MKAFIINTSTHVELAYSLFGVNISLENRKFNYCTQCRNEMKALIRAFIQCRTEFGSENKNEAYECLYAVENDIRNNKNIDIWPTNEFDISDLDMCDEDTYIGRALAREYYLYLANERATFII